MTPRLPEAQPPALVPRTEVARRLGLSVREVERIERRALLKCRAALEERGLSFRRLLELLTTPNTDEP